jgi:starch phosphorylase
MKLSLNGALTIGTLDGANIEIREQVGADNFFLFGMTAQEVERRKAERFEGKNAVAASLRLRAVIDALAAGEFSGGERERFAPIIASLLAYDSFMVAADFDAYWNAQRAVDALWLQPAKWWRAAILNTARMSYFSSDRAVREYAKEIWRVPLISEAPPAALKRFGHG